MKFGKFSRILSSLMLLFFCAILLVSVGMCISKLEYKSYIAAFAVGAVLFAVFVPLRKKLAGKSFLCDRLSEQKLCLILSAICLIVNGAWILIFYIEPSADFATYWLYAKALAENAVAVNHYVALFPHIFGYSLVISFFIRLFGAGRLLMPVVNVLLTCGSGILLFYMCSREYGRRAGTLAYLLWIFCPSKLIYNAMVLSEPFYTFLILLFFYLVYCLDNGSSDKKVLLRLLLAGLLSGLILRAVNSVRPIAMIPIIAFCIWCALLRGEKKKDKALWKNYLLFLLALLLAYIPSAAPWNSYMAQRLGEEPSTVPGYSVYVGFNPETNGSYSDDDMNELFSCYFGQELTANESHEQMLEKAKDRITSGDISFVPFFAEKLGTFLGNDEGGAYYAKNALSGRTYSLLSIISNVYYYFLVLLAIFGVLLQIQRKKFSALQLTQLYVIGLTCAHMLVEVAGRYHYSIIPMLVVSSAVTAEDLH